MKKYLAEFIGTFFLVFIGTGSIIVNDISNNTFGLVGIALSFGLIIIAMIYAFGSISGAHINPSVTIAFAFKKEIGIKQTILYIIFQILGAIFASLTLKLIFPKHQTLGMTQVSNGVFQSFFIEFISTFLLMISILIVFYNTNKHIKSFSGIIIGLVIIALIFVAGPISGGSFNPARSIGPALITGNLVNLWLYIVSPTIATISAVFIYNYFISIFKPS